MSMRKDTFLYLTMNDRLFGLNLKEFTERHSSKPELEVVQVLNHPTDHGRGIRSKDCMTVFNSNLYMITEPMRRYENLDLNVYSFDPTDPDDRRSMRLCDRSASPRLMDVNYPLVFNLEEKIYVLGVPSYSYQRRGNNEQEPQLFWVFDPFYESWRQLPRPPFFDGATYNLNYNVSYGHKLFVNTYNKGYVFDSHQERWEQDSEWSDYIYDKPCFQVNTIVEYGDSFLIAPGSDQQSQSLQLVAYKLDVKGIPQQHQVLHELNGMFPYRPLLNNPQALLGKCDDDDDSLMWLVYSGKDTCIGIAVFRVSMSFDHAGKEVFSIDIEAADYFDSKSLEVQGADEVHSAAAMCHDNLKTNRKDWFLYLNVGDRRLCRLNISEFCKWRSSFVMSKTFELVRDFHPEGRLSTIPSRMNHIIAGSKQYFVGGQRLDGRIHSDAQGRYFALPNLDIYALNYLLSDEGRPSITICQSEGSIPRLIDPRTKTIPITMTLDDKIYVLAKRPYLGDAEELNIHDQPPLFKVFDPLNQSWKHLPHPPCYDMSYRDTEPYVCNYFSWGHKLIIRTEAKKEKTNRGTYIFDTQQERWEVGKNRSAILDEGFKAVAEFKGFLIGMPYERQELVAYRLDADGIPILSNVLHELQGIFSSCSLVSDCFLGKVDGERMWLVYSAQDSLKLWHARVAVFRVVISNDWDGIEFFSADLEAAEFFQFDRFIASAFSYAQ